ncbi:MAG: hemerythrin [Curvibacter sp.]|nr:MAG: hemerythrin [Curvibacter sp.]
MTETLNAPATLAWSNALVLDMPVMDEVHREFVDLLERVVLAEDDMLMPLWSELIAHTQEHFDREDQWMRATGFAAGNCHATQHKVVLQVLREGEARGHGGDLAVVRQMADELGIWFPQHAQSMDASLALHLRSAGYDPATGALAQPDRSPKTEIHGCGGVTCSDTATA